MQPETFAQPASNGVSAFHRCCQPVKPRMRHRAAGRCRFTSDFRLPIPPMQPETPFSKARNHAPPYPQKPRLPPNPAGNHMAHLRLYRHQHHHAAFLAAGRRRGSRERHGRPALPNLPPAPVSERHQQSAKPYPNLRPNPCPPAPQRSHPPAEPSARPQHPTAPQIAATILGNPNQTPIPIAQPQSRPVGQPPDSQLRRQYRQPHPHHRTQQRLLRPMAARVPNRADGADFRGVGHHHHPAQNLDYPPAQKFGNRRHRHPKQPIRRTHPRRQFHRIRHRGQRLQPHEQPSRPSLRQAGTAGCRKNPRPRAQKPHPQHPIHRRPRAQPNPNHPAGRANLPAAHPRAHPRRSRRCVRPQQPYRPPKQKAA